jgi:hypothetical protein
MVTTASAPSAALGFVECLGGQVEGAHVVACLGEVCRHAAAHIAEPDETDACHVVPSSPVLRRSKKPKKKRWQ